MIEFRRKKGWVEYPYGPERSVWNPLVFFEINKIWETSVLHLFSRRSFRHVNFFAADEDDCSDVGEICWWKKVCWWRIFCMLVKLYVGEYRNLNVCWWSMLVKNLLYVGEKYCMLVKILNGNLNVCWWSMLVKFFLHVGEKYEQKFKCMLVKCVGENFPVCWWKVFSWKKV